MATAKDFKGGKPTWCPGCGDYGLLSALTRALAELGYQPHEVVIVSGIGCSGNFPHFTSTYGFHVTHGRALPAATGIAMANPELKVIAVGGDGDGLGIGVGHFIHTARRNLNITYTIMNNQIYGLTLGQASPTSQLHHITTTSPKPNGVDERPINAISLALGAGASFIARGYAGDTKHLTEILKEGIEHNGFSFIDTISPCVTWNFLNTKTWYQERLYDLQEAGHDAQDMASAFARSLEWGNKIPKGIFYKLDNSQSLQDLDRVTGQGIIPVKEKLGYTPATLDFEKIYNEFR